MKSLKFIALFIVSLLFHSEIMAKQPITNSLFDNDITSKAPTGSWFAYVSKVVSDSSTIEVINLTTNTSVASIPYGTETANYIVITPDANRVVSNPANTSTIFIIDTNTNTGVPYNTPGLITLVCWQVAITPDGTKAYFPNDIDGTVYEFDLLTNQFNPTGITVQSNPEGIAITTDGKKAYVSNYSSDSVSVVDLATRTVIDTISGLAGPFISAITPDNKTLYVLNFDTDEVALIDIATNTLLSTLIPVENAPNCISITPNGTRAFVANFSSSSVSVIDIATNTILSTIPVDRNPANISITPDGALAYVTHLDPVGVITVIDVSTLTIRELIPLGGSLNGIAITPDQAPTALFTSNIKKQGCHRSLFSKINRVDFDASASFSPVGSIANYFWNFGDGQTLSTSSPIAKHTYTSRCPVDATLTVTNTAGTSTTQTYTGQIVSNNGGPSAITTQLLNLHSRCNRCR